VVGGGEMGKDGGGVGAGMWKKHCERGKREGGKERDEG